MKRYTSLAVLAQPALPRLLKGRKMFGFHVFHVDGSAVTEEGGQRLSDSATKQTIQKISFPSTDQACRASHQDNPEIACSTVLNVPGSTLA
jgi:hypothetical protein